MKYLLFLLILAMSFFSCKVLPENEEELTDTGQAAEDDQDITSTYRQQVMGQRFDSSLYSGTMEKTEDAAALSVLFTGLTISEPLWNSINADGYFDLNCTITQGSNPTPYYLLTLSKGSEATNYWLTGDFNEKIWLRFGDGTYTAEFFQVADVTENAQGVITAWTWYTPAAATITIENHNSEDGRYLYPSQVIQSEDPAIIAEASAFSGLDIDEIMLQIHDWEVKELLYDLDSLNDALRRKQDALSALSSGMAVCEGYATLYAAMLRAWSIPTAYVTGEGNDFAHAWNWATNGSEWKFTDVTWDDPLWNGTNSSDYPNGENLQHTYFWGDLWSDHTLDTYDTDRRNITIPPPTPFPGYPEGFY